MSALDEHKAGHDELEEIQGSTATAIKSRAKIRTLCYGFLCVGSNAAIAGLARRTRAETFCVELETRPEKVLESCVTT